MPEVSGIGVPLIGRRGRRLGLTRGSLEKLEDNFEVPSWSGAQKNPLSVMVVLSEKNNHMADPNCKSLHLVFQHKTGSHGKYTEYLCYDCSKMSQTDPRPDNFLNVVTSQSKWMYIYLSEPGSNNHRAKGLLRK